MTVKSRRIPPLKLLKASGQGHVRVNGPVIYWGKYDRREAQQKYHPFVAEWVAGANVYQSNLSRSPCEPGRHVSRA